MIQFEESRELEKNGSRPTIKIPERLTLRGANS